MELLIVIYYLKFKGAQADLSLRKLVHIDTSYVQDYMHVSLPVLINQALWGVAQMVQTGILGHLGGDATAANAIAVQVYQVLSVVCYGAASASGIVVGRTIGEGNQQRLHPLVHTLQVLFVSSDCVGSLIFFCARTDPLRCSVRSPNNVQIFAAVRGGARHHNGRHLVPDGMR